MPRETFDEIWLPRVGASAAAQLRKSGYCAMVAGPVCLGLAVACSFAFGSGSIEGTVIGLCCGVVILVVFGFWVRSLVILARELSTQFGTTIRWSEMPRMQPTQFDEWCRKRGLPTPPTT
ncbi:hypothetical protein Back2_28380 [Nocardioides baekrokdamisoli]|uniref:Uncharacterized protein n=1 Tax=Nocardioides baekrokdamisoli TaxID=1804624 RepID=A0A3G9IXY8_9ACTN|nr:hypothetical protein Back2_28380 [Nocardioides baekrokdamisoli]